MTRTNDSPIITTIDGAGRVVVPKRLRERAGFHPGLRLILRLHDGRLEMEPAPREVQIRKNGHIHVADPVEEEAQLTPSVVERTRQALRDGS
jgi:AbrB family looped-hinge helix DNA binding protein